MTQNRDRKQTIRARMAATGEPYTVAARAISGRSAGTGDDFLADRHADLDAGEGGAGMTDADYYDRISASTETASLVDQITGAYREHAAEEAGITAVPGSVLGGDVEGQADALADAAARLAELLAAFAQEPRRSLDAIAVFRAVARSRWQLRPPSCAARSGSISMTRRTRRPRPRGPEPWKACGPPRAPSSGLLTAGSD